MLKLTPLKNKIHLLQKKNYTWMKKGFTENLLKFCTKTQKNAQTIFHQN